MRSSLRWHYPGQVLSGRQRHRCPLSPFDRAPANWWMNVTSGPGGGQGVGSASAHATGGHWRALCRVRYSPKLRAWMVAAPSPSLGEERASLPRIGWRPSRMTENDATVSGDQRTRELEVLAESSRLLTSTLDLAEVLDRLAEIARVRIGVDVVRIWLLDEGGDRLRLHAQKGATRQTGVSVTDPLSPDHSIAGWVISHREALCLTDVQRDERLANREWFAAEGFTSVLCVPILFDDRSMGMLGCLSRSRREFTEADVSLAQALTAPAVAAVRNAALYTEALARVEELRAFQRVASETLATPELETALRVVVRETHRLLRSDAALCTYVDQRTGEIRTLAGEGVRTGVLQGYRPTRGDGLSGLALEQGRPVRSDDYLNDRRFTRPPALEAWARAEGMTSVIMAPVIHPDGGVIAFLWAFNRGATRFTERDAATLNGLTQQTALAIDKARSFEDERRRAGQTTALLEIARACTSTLGLKPLLAEIARGTARVVGVEACAI